MQFLQNTISVAVAEAVSALQQPHNQPQAKVAESSDRSRGKKTLFAHLSLSVLEKIRRGEYVDFCTLLPPSISTESEPLAKRLRVSEDDGQLVVSTATNNKRKIENIYAWLEAWTIYCGVVFAEQPSKSVEFIGYQARILQAARKFRWSAVMEYDIAFRQSAAREPDTLWNEVDTDLYTRCFTGQTQVVCTTCKRTGHLASSCLAREGKNTTSKPVCAMYNSSRCSFPNCRFRHVCRKCGGEHPATKCTKAAGSA